MVSRLVRSELRVPVQLADYSSFRAAGVTPNTPFFPGVSAAAFLEEVNGLISHLENLCNSNQGMEFNWLNTYGDQTFLDYVKTETLARLKVNAADGAQAYRDFDVQVYYSKLVDLTGGF